MTRTTTPAVWKRLLSLAAALSLSGAAQAAAPAAANGVFDDAFTAYPQAACLTDGAAFGAWTVAFAGYGCVSTGPDGSVGYVQVAPQASTSAGQTHGALVLGPSFNAPSSISMDVRTLRQLRQGTAPNPWEVGWAIWNYADNSHFYYFQAKPNGWELGKEDPAYPGAQRFLATGASPAFPVGGKYTVKIVQSGANTMTVSVNGQAITTFTDNERPYAAGRIGFYSEDAEARLENVAVAPIGTAPAAPPVATAPVTAPAPAAAAPKVAAISPASKPAGSTAFNIAVDGSGFKTGAVVLWNGKACPGTVQSATRIVAYVSPADVAAAGTAKVSVSIPGVGVSNAATFTVSRT